MMKISKIQTKIQYSKQWMSRWQYFVMFWLSVFFGADTWFNHCEHLETLCITLVTSIIATMIPYFVKSYFETKQEKLMESQNRNFEEYEEIQNEKD